MTEIIVAVIGLAGLTVGPYLGYRAGTRSERRAETREAGQTTNEAAQLVIEAWESYSTERKTENKDIGDRLDKCLESENELRAAGNELRVANTKLEVKIVNLEAKVDRLEQLLLPNGD